MSSNEVQAYYERTQFLYNLLWSKKALSYGLWTPGTRTLKQALENQYQCVADHLQVTAEDAVLDLGCGTGGGAIRLAQLTGCHVVGLTLSPKQISQAKAMARAARVGHLVDFQQMNFDHPLPFPDYTFTKAYSVEALIYAQNKTRTLKEVHRIVKPGGRFFCMDGFMKSNVLSPDEKRSYDICKRGWAVTELVDRQTFLACLDDAGFTLVKYEVRTDQVIPSSNRIRRRGLFLWPLTWALSRLHIIPRALHENTLTMLEQRKAFQTFAEYGIVVATKKALA